MSNLRRPIRALLMQVHSVAGITLALLWAVVGLTGATMAFEDEIQASLNRGLTHVDASAARHLTPDELVARVHAAGYAGKVFGVAMAAAPTDAVRIRFARGESGAGPSLLYVDPYDGHVLGIPSGEDFFATVRRLHRFLLLPGDGDGWGRTITGIAALCLIAMLVSGLVLRWPHRTRSVKMWLKPNLALRGRGLFRSLHSVLGIWVLPVYLVTTLTGLTYSFAWYRDGAEWLLKRPVAVIKTAEAKPHHDASDPTPSLTFDRAWSTFLHDQGDRYARAVLMLPQGSGTIMRIRSWPRGSSLDSARDEFRIDALTGRLLSSDIYADKTLGEKMLASRLDIHRGAILGWPGKLAFMLAAALLPLFTVTGYLLYLSRRRHRRHVQTSVAHLVPGE